MSTFSSSSPSSTSAFDADKTNKKFSTQDTMDEFPPTKKEGKFLKS